MTSDSMFAVIFKTTRKLPIPRDYVDMNQSLVAKLSDMEGFLGVESVANDDGQGISISYWTDLDSIKAWKDDALHKEAQELGKSEWYTYYSVEICEVLSSYEKGHP